MLLSNQIKRLRRKADLKVLHAKAYVCQYRMKVGRAKKE